MNNGVQLNLDKCEYRKDKIEYFGHVISSAGIQSSSERVRAIQQLKPPTSVAELLRIIGMITYLGRFVPDLFTVLAPLNSLLNYDSAWMWDKPQEKAFALIKRLVTQAPVLAYYDSKRPTIVSADLSSFGIGAALYQTVDGELMPQGHCQRQRRSMHRLKKNVWLRCGPVKDLTDTLKDSLHFG